MLEVPRRFFQEAREEGLVVALPLFREVGHACPDLEEAARVAAGCSESPLIVGPLAVSQHQERELKYCD